LLTKVIMLLKTCASFFNGLENKEKDNILNVLLFILNVFMCNTHSL